MAFAWDGEKENNFDIYVKQIGVALPLRLTDGPEADIGPAWSPDGRTIAFLHVRADDKAEVRLMSAIAPGSARIVGTVTAQPRFYYRLRFIAWSPDGKWLAVSDGPNSAGMISVVLLSAETGQRIRVTFPPVNFDDFSPAFSPDMTRLIFVRYSNLGETSAGDPYMVKLSKDLHPWGEPERLTFFSRQVASPVWTADGIAILFARHEFAGSLGLWRMRLRRHRQIEPLLIPVDNSFTVALSPKGNRSFTHADSENANIWAVDLDRHRSAPCSATYRLS